MVVARVHAGLPGAHAPAHAPDETEGLVNLDRLVDDKGPSRATTQPRLSMNQLKQSVRAMSRNVSPSKCLVALTST